MISRTCACLGLAGVLLGLSLPASLSAQERGIAFAGSEIFCHLLKHFDLKPIAAFDDLADLRPEKTVIVVLGELTPLAEIRRVLDAHGLSSSSLDGYAVLLASNQPTEPLTDMAKKPRQVPRLTSLAPWRLTIAADEIHQLAEFAHEKLSRRPLLPPEKLSGGHPAFRGMHLGLVADEPKHLIGADSDLQALAEFPANCYSTTTMRKAASAHYDFIYGTGGRNTQRTLIVASHGVFCNGLMVKADADNFLFAYNTIRWLRDDPSGKRDRVLMIHDGNVVTNFELPPGLPGKLPQPTIEVINSLLRKLEDEGIFHRLLDRIGWNYVTMLVLLVSAAGFAAWGLFRLFLMRHAPESTPLVIGAELGAAPGRRPLDQRMLELLTRDNLWEPAQALARGWFHDHAGAEPPLWEHAHDSAPPAAVYRAGWWRRRRLAAQLRSLWSYSVRDPAHRVSLREFGGLTTLLQALTRAVNSSEIAFPMARQSTVNKNPLTTDK